MDSIARKANHLPLALMSHVSGESLLSSSGPGQSDQMAIGNNFKTAVSGAPSPLAGDSPKEPGSDTPQEESPNPGPPPPKRESPQVKANRIIRDEYRYVLQYNLDDNVILFKGSPLSIDSLYVMFLDTHGFSVPKSDLKSIVLDWSRKNAFSPLEQHVKSCRLEDSDNTDYIRVCAHEVLHTTDELDYVLLRRFLTGLVARALQPGCKMDNIFILKGSQGIGKSTFFEVLVGADRFAVMTGRVGDRESRMQLTGRWLIEWPELESVLGPSGDSTVKGFLSQSTDRYRVPYRTEVESFPRRSVFVGTTNQEQFLTDTTGNRRYWPVTVAALIDRNRLLEIRDKVIGQALRLFEAGEQWHLTDEEEARLRERVSHHEVDPLEAEPWENLIQDWVKDVPIPFMTSELLYWALGVEPDRQTTSQGKRVAAILRKLGYVKRSRRGDSGPRKMWMHKASPDSEAGDEAA